ncbi:MAG: response regulator, partial [Sedimentisphaerales bacterium]|nr:response regulator [Sedimentisphaerales bacterium]
DQREYAETIGKSADALLHIINDILDYSKVEAGKMTIEPVPIDIRQLITEVTDILAPKAEEKGLEFIVRQAPGTPDHVIGDIVRIRQILMNYVTNAIKFTHEGHVMVNIECRARTEDQATLYFSVEDTGIGIPENKIEVVFDKFTQADSSTTREYGGTGLGLAISKQLVELMGGQIGVESQLGCGSTFWFVLTLSIDRQAKARPPIKSSLKGTRILIIDDYEINRRVLTEQVTSWEIPNVACASGAEALEQLHKAKEADNPFHIAIVDYHMPDMDGKELAARIKSDPQLQNTVLVMLSSVGRMGEATEMHKSGFAAYLVKPVHGSQLLDTLTNVWGGYLQGADADVEEIAPVPDLSVRSQYKAVVLLVEDNLVNQKVAVGILKKYGCQVDVAGNGAEAVDMFSRHHYDLVFMDCQMPEMDGYEATAVIRQKQQGQDHIPIIAMTAHTMHGDKEKCLNAGMDDYIPKPVKREHLREMLDKWFYSDQDVPSEIQSMTHSSNTPETSRTPEAQDTQQAQNPPAAAGEGAPPEGSPAHFNPLGALNTLDGDIQALQEIADLYLSSTEENLQQLRDACQKQDVDLLLHQAHSLKGASANVGADRLAQLALEIEQVMNNRDLAQAQSILDHILEEFEQTRGIIEHFDWVALQKDV